MTFKPGQKEAYVWFRLPGEPEPVLCGRVECEGPGANAVHDFVYGRRYRARDNAVSLAPHSLPVTEGIQRSLNGLHGVLRDAAPDAWGRRVMAHRLAMAPEQAEEQLTEVDYLLGPGQARPGALLFSSTPDAPPDSALPDGDLAQFVGAVDAVERDAPMTPAMRAALEHGTSIGGARPKVLANFKGRPVIAKFSSNTDTYTVVAHEALALDLARAAGLDTPGWHVETIAGRQALMVERFDVDPNGVERRRHFFSALTALELHEDEARHASYPDLASFLNRYGAPWPAESEKLFRRMVFNILIGNTDDHARNHAVFWDGDSVTLTPAYDLCVIPRVGEVSSQAMVVGERGTEASLTNALSQAHYFGLDDARAREIAESVEQAIRDRWDEACDAAGIAEHRRQDLWGRAVLSDTVCQ